MTHTWQKGDRVLLKIPGYRKPFKAVYVRPAARPGYHYLRTSTPSGGYTKTYPARQIRPRPQEGT